MGRRTVLSQYHFFFSYQRVKKVWYFGGVLHIKPFYRGREEREGEQLISYFFTLFTYFQVEWGQIVKGYRWSGVTLLCFVCWRRKYSEIICSYFRLCSKSKEKYWRKYIVRVSEKFTLQWILRSVYWLVLEIWRQAVSSARQTQTNADITLESIGN